MAGILRAGPSLWFSGQVKPGGIPKIDWTHPLANGLVAYWFDTGAGAYQDLVTGRMMTGPSNNSSFPVIGASPYGTGFKNLVNAAQLADPAVAVQQSWSAPYSVAAGIFQISTPGIVTNPGYFGLSDTGGNDSFYIYQPTSTTLGISYANNSSAFSFTFAANTFYVVVGSATAASAQSNWVNGIAQTAGATTSTFAGSAMHYSMMAAGGTYNATSGVNGATNAQVFFGAVWLRTLNTADALQLYTDPYCFLMPWEGEMPALFSSASFLLGKPEGTIFTPGKRFGPTHGLRPTQAFPPSGVDSPQGETIYRVRRNLPYLGRGQLG